MKHKIIVGSICTAACLGLAGNSWAIPVPLDSSTFIELTDGSGMASGSVAMGHELFHFNADAGDLVTIDVDVTNILEGWIFTNNDTRLFLFDDLGSLLTQNDDFGGSLESRIEDFMLPGDATSTYYIGVTTIGNRPLLEGCGPDCDGPISGWADTGFANVEFDVNVEVASAPIPEPATMLLFGTGLTFFAGFRHPRRN